MAVTTKWAKSLQTSLPQGTPLPEDAWCRRHRAILIALWLHVPLVAAVGVLTSHAAPHVLLESMIVLVFALGASQKKLSRTARSSLATLGLVSSSAILVHFSNGLIEMHFHFFVMVAVVTLYQAWTPFLLAIAFVLLHHGTVGVLDAEHVYNHPSAIANPWKWALIHALFIAGESAAGLVAWKMNERALEREKAAREELQSANTDLAEAQSLASIGSWDWDLKTNELWWSEELYRMFRVEQDTPPTYERFMSLVHADDRKRVAQMVKDALESGRGFEYESKIQPTDGDVRSIHALGRMSLSPEGKAVRVTGTVQDITERKALEARIEHQAFHDSLTGLANRALFFDRVEHALSLGARNERSTAVLFLDLDDFKNVNDTMGHSVGDQLLQEVAVRIEDVLRSSDTFSRLGGDEFAILLEDLVEEEQGLLIAERILVALDDPLVVGGSEFRVGTSIGLTFSSAVSDEGTAEEIIRRADTAMYAAKQEGKGTYKVFEPGMADAVLERVKIKADLVTAIEEDQFFLHYQPIVRVGSGHISGVEALVRWMHPERGLIPPLDFIPVAEETGVIAPLTEWVLREACTRAAEWTRKEGSQIGVAVNISAARFRDPSLESELVAILRDTELDPQLLTLEITESVLVEDSDGVAARLNALKSLGVRIAIDDFGTGYSSLSYLRDFPIDVLKVDKAFIDSVALGPEDSALAKAVIKLGATLGMSVVAEGVEEEVQAAALAQLGCEHAQGFLFSRPVPAEQITLLLQNQKQPA